MLRFGRSFLVVLAIAIVSRCDRVISFQSKTPVSVKGKASLALLASNKEKCIEPRSEQSYHNGHRITPEHESDGDDADLCVLTRRDAVISAFSLATMAAWWPSQNALAAADGPFRVLFTIQIDSKKPNDLEELEVEVRPDWAPLAAQRFRELVELGFYKDSPFFRVLPGYVAQFGISSDPQLNKQWVYCDTTDEEDKRNCKPPLLDEGRTQANKKGTLSFASSGKNSRKTQIFINLANNDGPPNFLDAQNFVPFARIVRGMDAENNIPKRLNGEYGNRVNQGKAAYYGGEYFEAVFPKLSVIKDAKIL